MAGTERLVWWVAVVLPGGAALGVYGWSRWYFGGSMSTALATVGGLALGVGALVAYFWLVRGNGGFFGTLLLAMALLSSVATADGTAARGAEAMCVVRDVHSSVQHSFGEGGPSSKTVYRFALRCPGGYPTELKGGRRLAEKDEKVRVAYDPERRTAPAAAGDGSGWGSVWGSLITGVLLLVLSTVMAAFRQPRTDDAGAGGAQTGAAQTGGAQAGGAPA